MDVRIKKFITVKHASITISTFSILAISLWYYEPIKAFVTGSPSSSSTQNLSVSPSTEIGGAAWENYGKPTDSQLRKILTALQYEVTQRQGTEKPFTGEYDTNKAEGIYVDIVSGEPLFSSKDKYDSGTGWPAFVRPIVPEALAYVEDNSFFSTRIEVRSKYADSHLGHVFDDGPLDRGGKRYCINSASLRFVPKTEMETEGYGSFAADFLQSSN